MEIRESFRVRHATHGNPNVDERIAATFDRARRLALRESSQHGGAYVVDTMTNLTNRWTPVVVYRDGKLVEVES